MLEIGSLIEGKYKILNKIGQGGMSVVYLAMNEKANKQWAIKEVRKDGVKDFQVVKQGLVAEINLLKKLNHPHLPSIVDIIEDQETFLIVMDYIQGNPLSKHLEESKALPQELVIEWGKQLCDVLGYLHACNPPIIYRDMKPANIMLKPDGNITLIDFGTAREYKEYNVADTTCLGTIGYAAPEQFGGQGQTDNRTDIYCLGATLYHLVTGHNPSEPPYEMVPIRQINPSLSAGLEKIILKCTQKNPEDRYQSCAELMYDLNHYNEIDDKYMKKQMKKLSVFSSVFIASLIFFALSIFGYAAAEDKKGENYDIKLILARDAQNTKEKSIELYLDAIKIDPTDTRAYLGLIDIFLSSEDDNGTFSREEANIITQLQAGIESTISGNSSKIIYPFDELKSRNQTGYSEVCFEIGMMYWYDYEIEMDRYTYAVEWLKQAINQYPIAAIYCDMGELQGLIRKYSGQNRVEKVYEVYNSLWEKLVLLQDEVIRSDDNDIKYMVWSEIVKTISEKVSYFSVNVSKNTMMDLLNSIRDSANQTLENTIYEDIKAIISNLLIEIEEAKIRIDSIE